MESKTAVDILREHWKTPTNKAPLISAMEEYAKQKAIEFAEWCDDNYTRNMTAMGVVWVNNSMSCFSTEELYTLFNKQR